MIGPRQAPTTRSTGHVRPPAARGRRIPVAWGVVWGCLQAASPLALFWLDDVTVYAFGLTLIAAIYIGFAVADGRPRIITVEIAVAAAVRRRRRGRGDRIAVAAGGRARRARAEGPVAAEEAIARPKPGDRRDDRQDQPQPVLLPQLEHV